MGRLTIIMPPTRQWDGSKTCKKGNSPVHDGQLGQPEFVGSHDNVSQITKIHRIPRQPFVLPFLQHAISAQQRKYYIAAVASRSFVHSAGSTKYTYTVGLCAVFFTIRYVSCNNSRWNACYWLRVICNWCDHGRKTTNDRWINYLRS